MTKILSIEHIVTTFISDGIEKRILDDVSFHLNRGEILGLVGASGSGKSITAMTILGLLDVLGGKRKQGKITYHKKNHSVDLTILSSKEYSKIRGNEIGVIFQDAVAALNPTQRCGRQLEEACKDNDLDKEQSKDYILTMLNKVRLEEPNRIYESYPHEISGGQAQRVMISMALLSKPTILIADEPTSSLDTITQRSIVDLLKSLSVELKLSVIFISHNLPMLDSVCDRIIRMKDGKIVCKPNELSEGEAHQMDSKCKLDNLNDEKVLELDEVSKYFEHKKSFFSIRKNKIIAVDQVSISIHSGQIIGLIGSSGSGKSTIANLIIKQKEVDLGEISFLDKNIQNFTSSEQKIYARDVQVIYQNSYGSLDPRWTILEILMEPLEIHQVFTSRNKAIEAMESMLQVLDLPSDALIRYPHQFSGGQRQRIAVARALLLKPKLLVCDECIASLDIDNQFVILDLLKRYNKESSVSILFISHNLETVIGFVDEVHVMKEGKIVEVCDPQKVIDSTDSYVQELLTSCKFD